MCFLKNKKQKENEKVLQSFIIELHKCKKTCSEPSTHFFLLKLLIRSGIASSDQTMVKKEKML
jgi:hypothetical protein